MRTALLRDIRRRSCGPFSNARLRQFSSPALAEVETIPFPREGPGVSYALNWALAAKGCCPQGEAYRNLKSSELQKHGAVARDLVSGSSVMACGSFSSGAIEISKAQFKGVLKKVTSHLSSVPKLFVYDGALGSSPKVEAKTRAISDNPTATLAIQDILCRTSLRQASYDAFPLTVYIASGLSRPSVLDAPQTASKADSGFIVADYDTSEIVLGGKAFADFPSLKGALAAVAAPILLSHGAIPLAARILTRGDSVVLVFAPESLVQKSQTLRSESVTDDANCIWTADGVATLFRSASPDVPNLFKAPKSIVFITADGSGALPSVAEISPGQAIYNFLAGYDGNNFVPAYQSGPASVAPLSIAKELLPRLIETKTPVYLINANDGEKTIEGKELLNLIDATVSQKLPKVKGKKSTEAAVMSLKSKIEKFVSERFPELPEGVSY